VTVSIVETVTSISTAISTSFARITVTVPEPASIRLAASPLPADASKSRGPPAPGRTPLYKPEDPIVEEVVEEVPIEQPPLPPLPPLRRAPRIIEVFEDEDEGPEEVRTVTVRRAAPTAPRVSPPSRSPPPRKWFGGGW